MLKYVKIFIDSLDELESLTNEEAGSLLTNLLQYGKFKQTGGEFFEPNFVGNESYVFPTFRKQIEREFASYEEMCNKNRENSNKKVQTNHSVGENTQTKNPLGTRRGERERTKELLKDKKMIVLQKRTRRKKTPTTKGVKSSTSSSMKQNKQKLFHII